MESSVVKSVVDLETPGLVVKLYKVGFAYEGSLHVKYFIWSWTMDLPDNVQGLSDLPEITDDTTAVRVAVEYYEALEAKLFKAQEELEDGLKDVIDHILEMEDDDGK